MAHRLEITISPETLARLDEVRGHEPRASFVKRALESALGDGAVDDGPRSVARPVDESAASTRAPVEKEPSARPSKGDDTMSGKLNPASHAAPSRPARNPALSRQAALNKAKGL